MPENGQILQPNRAPQLQIAGRMGSNAQVAVAMLPTPGGPKMLLVGGESKLHCMTRAVIGAMKLPEASGPEFKQQVVAEACDLAQLLVDECDRRMMAQAEAAGQ